MAPHKRSEHHPKFPEPDEEDKPMKLPPALNFNSLLGIIAVMAIGWVGMTTQSTSGTVTELKTQLPYVAAALGKLENQIQQMVTRGELDSFKSEMAARNSVIEAKNEVMNKRVMQLEFEKKRPADAP